MISLVTKGSHRLQAIQFKGQNIVISRLSDPTRSATGFQIILFHAIG